MASAQPRASRVSGTTLVALAAVAILASTLVLSVSGAAAQRPGARGNDSNSPSNTDPPLDPDDAPRLEFVPVPADLRGFQSSRPVAAKHLTTSGRVRSSRHVVWLIEGSEAMNRRVRMPSGLDSHKGATAMDFVVRTLNARSQGLTMAFEIWRGPVRSDDTLTQAITHRDVFDAANGQHMNAVVDWLSRASRREIDDLGDGMWQGTASLIPSLRRSLAVGPDSIILVAGSMPIRPPVHECPPEVELGSWVVSQLTSWSGDRSPPPIHILGIGLDSTSGAFFERIAQATGGTITEFGAAIE